MNIKLNRILLRTSLVVLAFVIGIGTYRVITMTNAEVELGEIQISSENGLLLNAGETTRLTAEIITFSSGDMPVSSGDMPVNINWSITKNADLASLGDCDSSTSCDFYAGNEGGTVKVEARMEDSKGSVKITIVAEESPFPDEIPSWSKSAVFNLNKLGIIKGKDSGLFDAAGTLTRGELITLIHRLLVHKKLFPADTATCNAFADITSSDFMYFPACALYVEGFLDGGSFRPNEPASRGVTAEIMARIFGATFMDAMEIETISAQHFNDVPVGNAHFSAIEVMNETEIMTGKSEGQFAPYDTLNRAEAAIIIQRAMQKIELLNIKKLMK